MGRTVAELILVVAVLWAPEAGGQSQTASQKAPQALKQLSLEELSQIEITTAGRKEERLSRTAAAVSVITQEEIRRAGVRSIPEALRLATGLHVARFNNGSWAISARGFNITTANKLQVLLDGRTVYTPLFSGVFWDVQDTLIEDIERIEVVRGPGATLWGANAVNGVINIITKRARDSQGALLVGGAGSEERAFASARFGGKLGDRVFYRVYSKYFFRDSMATATGADAKDSIHKGDAGFRAEWEASGKNLLTVQGDIYRGNSALFSRKDSVLRGGNMLARWTHAFANGSELQLQAYYDRTSRFVHDQFDEVRNTYDVDMQHRQPAGRHELVWGVGYRASRDRTLESPILFFEPAGRTLALFSTFVQDTIALVPDRFHAVVGSKFERNTYTGFEIQPTFRLSWTPDDKHNLWGAVSRAVRAPTRFDQDLRIRTGPTVLIRGDRAFRSEELIAYELGYRVQPHPRFTLDAATFYNDYDHLRSQERPLVGAVPIVLENLFEGKTYGAEIGTAFQLRPWWRLHAAYTNLQGRLQPKPGSRDITGGRSEANDPRNQFSFRSYMDLPGKVELDFWFRHVSTLPTPPTPNYAVFDVRLGWRPTENLEFSLVGQNLPERQHREFGPAARPEDVQRGVFGKVAWRF